MVHAKKDQNHGSADSIGASWWFVFFYSNEKTKIIIVTVTVVLAGLS